MSVTCCPLSDRDGDKPSCSRKTRPKARKEHKCCECAEVIAPGATYERFTGIWDGSSGTFATCLICVEIRDHFACEGGYTMETLWSDLEDHFFPDMKAGGPCMEGLSPAAKGRMFERRMAWLVRP